MNNHEKLNSNQKKVISALLTHRTIADAAEAAGLTERTVYNYLNNETFKAALAEAEAQALAHVARTMAVGADKASQALLDVLDNEEATISERIQAAKAFLSLLPNIRLLGSIESKLAALEAIQ